MDAKERKRRRRTWLWSSLLASPILVLGFLRPALDRWRLERQLDGWTEAGIQEQYSVELAALRKCARHYDEFWLPSGAPRRTHPLEFEALEVLTGQEVVRAGFSDGEVGLEFVSRTPASFSGFCPREPSVGRPALGAWRSGERRFVGYEEILVDEDVNDRRIELVIERERR